jgi:hypothetical protein
LLVVLLVVAALFEIFAVLFLLVVDVLDVEIIFAPLTTEWVDVLLVEAWPLTRHLQTFVREPAARSGRGDVLRLMMSQNSQNAWPYLTSPLKVLRSVAEQAEDISDFATVLWWDIIRTSRLDRSSCRLGERSEKECWEGKRETHLAN